MIGDTVDGLFFSSEFLDTVAARNDPKTPFRWHVQYAARVNRDYAEIAPWLPDATRIMDIGCGFAGIDALFGQAGVHAVHLIDGATWGTRVAGFQAETTPWNDVELAARLVRDNAPDCAVTTAAVPPVPAPCTADVVISLKSWGHHYPIGVYLDLVKASLVSGGTLILDVRKGSFGVDDLIGAGFALRGRAGGTLKCDRMVFQA